MFDIVAAVNDERILSENLMRSEIIGQSGTNFIAQREFSSAALAYNSAIESCDSDLVVFAHQDVYLPKGWEEKLANQIALIEVIDPEWAVLGTFGITRAGDYMGWVWSSGLERSLGGPFTQPAEIQSADELLIVLRKSSGLKFDDRLPGFHLYGTDLVQSAIRAKKGAYVICAPVVHNSRPCPYLDSNYFKTYKYMQKKWHKVLPIKSCAAPIVAKGSSYCTLRFRHKVNEVRHSRFDRSSSALTYDCVDKAKELGFEAK